MEQCHSETNDGTVFHKNRWNRTRQTAPAFRSNRWNSAVTKPMMEQCSIRMNGSANFIKNRFQVNSLSPSEEEMLKLMDLFKTIAERFTKQELLYVQLNKHLRLIY